MQDALKEAEGKVVTTKGALYDKTMQLFRIEREDKQARA